jgi:RNA polymerase sigma-70 factor (ECF subfamily)
MTESHGGSTPEVFEHRISAARGGSNRALGELLDQWRDYLLLMANHEIGRDLCVKAGASDVVQETFKQAHRSFATFRGNSETEWLAWLRRILLRQVFDLRRRYSRTLNRDVRREQSFGCNQRLQSVAESLAAEDETPFEQLMASEDSDRVSGALESLSNEEWQVIWLRYWENLSFAQIGELTGRSSDSVRKYWFRIVRKLALSSTLMNAEP